MNINDIIDQAHCSSQGRLHYNQPVSGLDVPQLQKTEMKAVKAYCLVAASECPYHLYFNNNDYCSVSEDWLKK